MKREVLSIAGLRKSFPAATVLDNVSFSVREGEYVSLLGRSGCGKSTLLNILAGLLLPDGGQILCDGLPISGPDRHRMLMFQDAALFPWLDVMDNVLYGLRFVAELGRAAKRARAEAFLEMVGLSEFRHFRVHELSGGMRQRAALARALAPDPDVLLMDEPFSALDAMTREQLYADVQRIWSETGKTVIMVTHNVREAVCLGSRILLMEHPGRLILDEPVSLPYPRDMNDVGLTSEAARISAHLKAGQEGL